VSRSKTRHGAVASAGAGGPGQIASGAALAKSPQASRGPGATADRILVVGVDEVMAHSIRRTLREGGFDSELASSPTQALERLAGADFVGAVCDLRMPALSAAELLRGLRAAQPDLAVLAVTGGSRPWIAAANAHRGAYAYVLACFSRTELLNNLSHVLALRRMELLDHEFDAAVEQAVAARTTRLRAAIGVLGERCAAPLGPATGEALLHKLDDLLAVAERGCSHAGGALDHQ
jgi:CheY-like chemotaxis protein